MELFHDAAPGSYLPPEEISRLAKVIVEQAKGDLRTFVRNCSPSRESVRNMAQHAIKLAYLDDIFRAGRLDKHFQDDVPAEEVNDLVELLDIVPFETLLDNRNVLLNPTFGDKASKLVGGADADLIVGSHLIDIKVTISDSVKPQHLDQLLGYFFLTRYCQRAGDSCPDVSRAGIYFARHGYLLSFGTDEWLNNPHFGEIEGWFLARAQSQIMHLKMLT